MTTNHRFNGFLLAGAGSMLTLFCSGLLGLLTMNLFRDLSPSGIGPVTAACSYVLVGIFLALSVAFVRSGIWQIKYRRRNEAANDIVQRMIPFIIGLGVCTPLFRFLFEI